MDIASFLSMDGFVALVVGIFLIAFFLIITERFHRTIIALLASLILIVFGVFKDPVLGISSQVGALNFVDFNTLGMLIGMMIIVFVIKQTGFFQYAALYALKIARGDPWSTLVYLSIVTFVCSALLDNVTTVMLVVPVTIAIASEFKTNPFPFLLLEILASNIGGSSTLIGDPTNILIGSAATIPDIDGVLQGVSFNQFAYNMGLISVIQFVVVLIILYFVFGRNLSISNEVKEKIMNKDLRNIIKNKTLLYKSFFVLLIVIIGFITHTYTHIDLATISMLGGSFLLLLTHHDDEVELEESLEKIEWTVIFFFLGLFVMVGALEQVGVINMLSTWLIGITHNNINMQAMVILWGCGLFSSVVDNVPFVITMIPIIQEIGKTNPESLKVLWWALSMGACFGGCGSVIGASCNVIVSGIAEKSGNKMTFFNYFKYGFPIMILMLMISSVYIWARYLI